MRQRADRDRSRRRSRRWRGWCPASRRRMPRAARGRRRSPRPRASSSGGMLSSRIASAPAASASRTWSSVSHLDLHRKRRRRRASRSTATRSSRRRARWLSLIEDRVVEPEAVVAAAAARDRVLLERAQPGRRLARVEDLGAGALDGVHVPARERGDAGEAAEEVERRALAGQDRRGAAREARDDRPAVDRVAVGGERFEAQVGIERVEDVAGDVEAADDAGLLHEDLRRAGRIGGDDRWVVRSPVPTSSASAADELRVSLRPCLEHGLLPGTQDDVRLEARILVGEVGAEVRAAALLAGERALGHRGARSGGRSGAAGRGRRGRGRDPRRARTPGAAQASRRSRRRGRGGWLGHAQLWLVQRGERGPAAEDEALEQ